MAESYPEDDRIPVVVATGQAVERDREVYPVDLAQRACESALSSASEMRSRIDRVCMVNILTGGGSAPAGALSRRLGLHDTVNETSTVGGNSPQWLVNRAAELVAAGAAQAVLIAGAEAQRSKRVALARRDSPGAGGSKQQRADDDRPAADALVGDDRPGVGPAELAAGLIAPVHLYALFESVLAGRAGRSFEEQRVVLGELMAPFTEVAAKHPYAWFQQAQNPAAISTVDADNRLVSEPYPKKMCAFMQVDQAACVLVTSLAAARAARVADAAVFCWSGADASDVWFPVARPDPGSSPAIAAAASAALGACGLGVDDVSAIDLYSCFPCVVEMAVEAMGLRADDPRGLTVTGGLPYFGGPGNDYTLHAIATMTERLREHGGTGLVSGLGWYSTKHSIGIYGARRPSAGWRRGDTARDQERIDASAVDVLEPADLDAELASRSKLGATVVASTVTMGRDGAPSSAPLIARVEGPGGVRQVALAAADEELAFVAGRNLVGGSVEVSGSPPRYRVVG